MHKPIESTSKPKRIGAQFIPALLDITLFKMTVKQINSPPEKLNIRKSDFLSHFECIGMVGHKLSQDTLSVVLQGVAM